MNLVDNEKNAAVKQYDGRIVKWVQTPEITGGNHCSVCVVEYEPGERSKPAHAHDKGEETMYVVEGYGKTRIGDQVYDLEPGSVALFPQSVPHAVWNTGDCIMKLVCFYAPDQSAIEYTFYEDFDFDEFR